MFICDYLDENVKNYLNVNNSSRTILTFFKEPFDEYKGNKVIFIDDMLDNRDYQTIDNYAKNILNIFTGSLKFHGYDLFKYLIPEFEVKLGKLCKYKYSIDKLCKIKSIYNLTCSTSEKSLIEWIKNDYKVTLLPFCMKNLELSILAREIRRKIVYSKLRYTIESFVSSFFLEDHRKNIPNILWAVAGNSVPSSPLMDELIKDFKIYLFDVHRGSKLGFIKKRKKVNLLKLKNYKEFRKIRYHKKKEYNEIINKVSYKMKIKQEQAEKILNLHNKIEELILCVCLLEENIGKIDLLMVNSSVDNIMALSVDFFKKHKLPSIEMIHGFPDVSRVNKNISKVAVYGQRDKLFYTNHGADVHKIVLTGTPRYDKCFYIKEENKKYNYLLLILDWIPFSPSSNTSRVIFKQVTYMVRLIEQLQKVKLIIKLHPTQSENELMYVRSLVFKNNYYKRYVEVVKDSDTNELLKTASIVFTHSSSVGVEALLMKKAVIILDILSGFKPIYKGYNGFLIAKDFDQILMLTRKVLRDIDEYLRSNSKNIEKTKKFFYDDSKGESYKRVANLARDCINVYNSNNF